MKKYVKRRKSNKNTINLGLPNHKDECKIKSITYNKNSIVENGVCPACNGEGVDFIDWTNARGGNVDFRICDICEGNGTATEDKDYKIAVFYDHKEGQQLEYVKINDKGE